MGKQIHFGKIVKEQLELQGRNEKWLGKQLFIDWRSIYKELSKSSCSSKRVETISDILQVDLFLLMSQEYNRNREKAQLNTHLSKME